MYCVMQLLALFKAIFTFDFIHDWTLIGQIIWHKIVLVWFYGWKYILSKLKNVSKTQFQILENVVMKTHFLRWNTILNSCVCLCTCVFESGAHTHPCCYNNCPQRRGNKLVPQKSHKCVCARVQYCVLYVPHNSWDFFWMCGWEIIYMEKHSSQANQITNITKI